MARYIKDNDIIKLALSEDGIKLIRDFIQTKEGELPILKTNKVCYSLLTRCFISNDGINFSRSTSAYSNTLIVSDIEICINPVMDFNHEYYTNDLYEYINNNLKSEIRNFKLKKIL
jgi:hypothetical protein